MPDLYDLLSVVKADPNALKKILEDKKQVNLYALKSDQLEALKKMDPEHIKMILEGIEYRLRVGPVAGTNACPGTFACIGGNEKILQEDFLKKFVK